MAYDFAALNIAAATGGLYDILKFVYGTGLTNQFADEKTTYNQFPMSDRKPKGKGYEFGVRKARAQGHGARLESAKLPAPLVGKFDTGRILPKYIYGSIRITGPAIEAAKGDVAAFVDGLSDQVDDIYQSVIVDLNRMSWGDSWGKLGKTNAANTNFCTHSAGTTVGTTNNILILDNDTEVRYLQTGMLVDLYATGGAAPLANGTKTGTTSLRISKIDPTTHTITFELAAKLDYGANHPRGAGGIVAMTATMSVPANALILKEGARSIAHTPATDPVVEMMGLLGIYDDGTDVPTFENITVSSNPFWKANRLTNGGVPRELSMDLMLRALDLTRRQSGQSPAFMRMGLGMRRKYANLLMPDVRFAPTVLRGGYETLTFAGGDGTVTIVIDPVAQPARIFFEPEGNIKKYEMTPLGWGNLDQQMHWRSGYDEWDMFLRIYTNLGTEQRNALTMLGDLVEPTLF